MPPDATSPLTAAAVLDAAESPPTGAFTAVLRHRPFAWLIGGQSVSLFGDNLHAMALIGLIGAIDPGSSPLVMAGFAVLYSLPFLFIAPIAGVLVDRWDRKRTLIVCDAARAILVASMPLAYGSTGRVAPVFALVFAVFVFTLFFDVAKMAIIPDLVGREELLEANAVASLSGRLATLMGIVIGGMIVGWQYWRRLGLSGYKAGFYIDALTFLVSLGTLLALSGRSADARVRLRQQSAQGLSAALTSVRDDLRQLVATFRRNRSVFFVLASSVLLGLIGGCMYVVVVVVVQTRTTWGTAGVGFVFGLMACGIVPGSALVGQFGRRWRRSRLILGSFAAIGVLMILSARTFAFALHGPLSFLGGLALGPILVAQDTLLHECLADEVRGRVFSARDVVLNVAFGVGASVTGLTVTLLSRSGVQQPFRATLLVAGPLVLLTACAGAVHVRRRNLA